VTNDEDEPTAPSDLSSQPFASAGKEDHPHHPHSRSWRKGLNTVGGVVHDVEEKVLGKLPLKQQKYSKRQPSKASESSGDDDDEEGWASETSDSEQPVAGTSSGAGVGTLTSTKAEGKRRSREEGEIERKGRQHNSLQRMLTTGAARNRVGLDDGSEEESRGRSSATTLRTESRSLTPHASQSRITDSAVNQRLESIRAQASRAPTREASPCRSVRFVDEPGDGTGSARASRIWFDNNPQAPSRSIDVISIPPAIEKGDSTASSSPSLGGEK
jgi:hypothetical protein